jgi:hypothetical protein
MISANQLLQEYLQAHFPLSPTDLISQASLIVLQHEESLKALVTAKSSQIVDEDGFTLVVSRSKRSKRAQAEEQTANERVFQDSTSTTETGSVASAPSSGLYKKTKHSKKQNFNQEIANLRSKFQADIAKLCGKNNN